MAYVWYIGSATKRELRGPEWPDGLVVWSISNGWSVPQSKFNQSQLNLLDLDSDFLLDQEDEIRVRPNSPDPIYGNNQAEYWYAKTKALYDEVNEALETGEFKGEPGPAGKGISSIALSSDTLIFHMTTGPDMSVVVPSISTVIAAASAASASADAASGSAALAGTRATASQNSASDALAYRNSAETYKNQAQQFRNDASGFSVAAQGSADAASISAAEAAASAQEAADVVGAGVPNATTSAKGGVQLSDVKGEVGGSWDHMVVNGWDEKADLVGGKIPTSQIPSLATVETHVVNTTAERLALTSSQVQPGDKAIQLGNPGRGTYSLRDEDPSLESSWVLNVSPTDAVSSVNGYQGIVVLAKSDLGLGNVDNTSDANKPVSSATQSAINGKVSKLGTGYQLYAVENGVDVGMTFAGNAAPAWSIAQRGDNGVLKVGTPSASGDATTKAYVDTAIGTRAASSHSHSADDINSGTLSAARLPAITSAMITDGTIVNADISGSAAIAASKLAAAVQTSLGKADSAVQGSGISLWKGTASAYAAIGTKDANTVYVVAG